MIKKIFLGITEEQINSVANQPILVEAEGVEGAEGVRFLFQITKIHLSKGMNIKDRLMSP